MLPRMCGSVLSSERLRAVPALEQERLAAGDVGEPGAEPVDLRGHGDRRHALQHGAHLTDGLGVRPVRLLGRRTGQRVVQPVAQLGGQRGQLGQGVDRHVNGPVHENSP